MIIICKIMLLNTSCSSISATGNDAIHLVQFTDISAVERSTPSVSMQEIIARDKIALRFTEIFAESIILLLSLSALLVACRGLDDFSVTEQVKP